MVIRGDVETLASLVRGGGVSYRLNECTECMSPRLNAFTS